jgi:protein gp37
MLEWFRERGGKSTPAHIWVGVSVESNSYLWRIDRLREVNAAVRFVSAEPLLGTLSAIDLNGVSWLITGGESGGPPERALVMRTAKGWEPKPEALTWVRELRNICRERGVAFFHKQWGGPTPTAGGRRLDQRIWDEMPAALGEPALL